jgi:hypothetical protein
MTQNELVGLFRNALNEFSNRFQESAIAEGKSEQTNILVFSVTGLSADTAKVGDYKVNIKATVSRTTDNNFQIMPQVCLYEVSQMGIPLSMNLSTDSPKTVSLSKRAFWKLILGFLVSLCSLFWTYFSLVRGVAAYVQKQESAGLDHCVSACLATFILFAYLWLIHNVWSSRYAETPVKAKVLSGQGNRSVPKDTSQIFDRGMPSL